MQNEPIAPSQPAAYGAPHARHGSIRASIVLVALLAASGAHANIYCVHNATELRAALTDAGVSGTSNNQDNTIRVAGGTYTTSGAPFFFGSLSGFALTIEGGYNSACSSKDSTPGVSVLDGANLTQVLSLQSDGDITVRNLTIERAFYNVAPGGGAAIALIGAGATSVAVFDSNVVLDNFDGFSGVSSSGSSAGLSIFGNGTVYIENNLFTGNSGPTVSAFSANMTVGTVYITNNTITDNTNTSSGNAIVSIGSSTVTGHVSNTISYGNHGTSTDDFLLYGIGKVDFFNNDYSSISGTPAPGGSGNFIGVDPQFVAADDFHLRSTSPLLRVGTLTPAGGLPATDIEGNPRSVDGNVDIGAYENVDYIFANGFDPI